MKSEVWTYTGFAIVLLLGLFLRVRPIHESLWLDELHTAWTVSDRFSDVVHRSHWGNQSPLYPWIIWGTTRTLGLSEVTLRLPSVLAGIALMVASGFIVWRWSASGPLGLLTSFLIAIDPHSIFFAQEARAYALVQLAALLQIVCFSRLVLGDANRYIRMGWIGLTWVLFYLHYTSLLLLLGEFVFTIAALRFRWTRRDLRVWFADLVLIVTGLLPAVPHLQEIAARRDNWSKFIPLPDWRNLLTVFRMDSFLLAPSIVFGLVAGLAWIRGKRWTIETGSTRRMLLLACCLVWPLLVAWVATKTGSLHLFFRRYLMAVAVTPMILAGLIGAVLPGATRRRGYALLSALAAALLVLPLRPIDIGGVIAWHSPENWRDAVASINSRPELHRLPVFVRSGLIEDDGLRGPDANDELIEFCLLPVKSLYRLEDRSNSVEPLPGSRSWELSKPQTERLSSAGGAWLIVRGTPQDAHAVGRYLQAWVKQHGINVTVQAEPFGNVTVLLLRVV